MGVWQDKLDGCTSLKKSTKKFEQVSSPPVNFSSANPGIQVLFAEIWSASVMGSNGNVCFFVKTKKSKEWGNEKFTLQGEWNGKNQNISIRVWPSIEHFCLMGTFLQMEMWLIPQGVIPGKIKWITRPLKFTNNMLLCENCDGGTKFTNHLDYKSNCVKCKLYRNI